jgi:hypothetical protein
VAEEFEQNAELSSLAFGMPNNRFVVVPDSPEGIAPEKIREEIDDVVDRIVECLTTPALVAGGGNGAGPATAVRPASVEQYQGGDQFEALERFNQAFLEKSRGDGFSLVPPTPERVEEMLTGTTRSPDDVIAVLQPGMGIATVEKIAISCVMAGCQPSHLPVIMAAVKAIEAMGFYARGWLMSTSVNAPMLFLGGPIVEELGIHTGQCTLGPSKWSMTNIVLGRALRLVLMNVGYNRPREMDMDTIGTPLKWSLCTAENQDSNPWEPFGVEHGFAEDTNLVCVTSVTNQIEVADFVSEEPEPLLNEFVYGTWYGGGGLRVSSRADPVRPQTMGDPTGQRKLLPGGLFIMMAPEHAELLGRHNWPKSSVKNYLWLNQRLPAKWVANLARWCPPHEVRDEWKWLLKASDYELNTNTIPSRDGPFNYHVAVVGGWGAKSLVFSCSEISMVEVTDRVL